MKSIADFAASVSVPLGLLNVLVGAVAGLWLAVLGRWDLLGLGLAAILLAGFVAAAFARSPGLLLDVPAAMRRRPGHRLRLVLLRVLGCAYRVTVIGIWCLAVLWVFHWRSSAEALAPVLLWSYAVAAGPIVWMDQNEIQGGGGIDSAIVTLFAQVACIVVLLAFMWQRIAFERAAGLFAAIMGAGLIVLLTSVSSHEEAATPP